MSNRIVEFIFSAFLVASIIVCLQFTCDSYLESVNPASVCREKCRYVFPRGSFFVGDGGECTCTEQKIGRPGERESKESI